MVRTGVNLRVLFTRFDRIDGMDLCSFRSPQITPPCQPERCTSLDLQLMEE